MTITMNDSKLNNIDDIKRFLQSTQEVSFKRTNREETYRWIEQTLVKFNYMGLSKADKGIIKQYLAQVTRPEHFPFFILQLPFPYNRRSRDN